MLNWSYIEKNPDKVQENILNRGLKLDIQEVLQLNQLKKTALGNYESQQHQLNQLSNQIKDKSITPEKKQAIIQQASSLKQQVNELQKLAKAAQQDFENMWKKVPNMSLPETPVGLSEQESVTLQMHGEKPEFAFPVQNHLQLNEKLDLFDFQSAAQTSGSRFYYLKNQAVLLEQALVRYSLDFLQKKGFMLIQTPDLARLSVIEHMGFQPRGQESNIYTLEDTDLALIATSEIPLGAYYQNQKLNLSQPKLLAGLSHCFRKEAGSYGQESKGLYRVHQFTKVEMFIVCSPEQSLALHQQLLQWQQELLEPLNLHYRVLDICTCDLGSSAMRKFDIEAWMPGLKNQGAYGEITSASLCGEYQACRLKIAQKDAPGWAHTLNGTAMACARMILALLENGQQADGSVVLPSVLHPYTGFSCICPIGGKN